MSGANFLFFIFFYLFSLFREGKSELQEKVQFLPKKIDIKFYFACSQSFL